ncbi:protein kinase domain-containing protein [Myceligenerans crystallogenes]|uniref:Protein kinase domain-containing protein n=1 Tax=Myceligenerans crystallogenes TaxID=316335 RepID=A0ABP4ZRZ0_9MICO
MPSDRAAVLDGTTKLEALRPRDPRRAGRFRLRGRLGAGAMGTVFLGADRRGRRVAIKFLREEFTDDPAFRTRFRREVEAASQVHGRWIARLVEADADANPPWMATEYVDGPNVSQAVGRNGPLPPAAVLDLVRGVAHALMDVHATGLVHRDVKPGNVILGPDGPRLIDLGVVGVQDATRLTTTGTPIGTPACMSPEQASNGVVGASSDIWSLGALAWFAATGKHLYTGHNTASLLYQVVHERPDTAGGPEWLLPLLEACLRRVPAERPSAAQVLDLVGPGLANAPEGAELARYTAAAVPAAGAGQDENSYSRGQLAVGVATIAALAGSAAGLIAWAPWEPGETRLLDERILADARPAPVHGVSHIERAAGERGDKGEKPGASPTARPTAAGPSAEPSPGGDATALPDPASFPDATRTPPADAGGGSEPPAGSAGEPTSPAEPTDPGPSEEPPPATASVTYVHGTVGRCLTDVPGRDPSLTRCENAPAWETTTLAAGGDQIRHPATGECLSVNGYRNLTSVPCDGSALQGWYVVDYGARFGLRNAGSGECVTVHLTYDVATVAGTHCGERAGQLWTWGG